MELQTDIPPVQMQIISGCLVASMQSDLTTDLLRRFQQDLLQRIKTSRVSAVILDVSAVEIMDLEDFELMRRSMAMAAMMGARSIVVGLRPGIVSSLIALDARVDDIEGAADLDDALERVKSVSRASKATAEDTVKSLSGGRPANETASEAGAEDSRYYRD